MKIIDILNIPEAKPIAGIDDYIQSYFYVSALTLNLVKDVISDKSGKTVQYNNITPKWNVSINSRILTLAEFEHAKSLINLLISQGFYFKAYAPDLSNNLPESLPIKQVVNLKNITLDAKDLLLPFYFNVIWQDKVTLHQALEIEDNKIFFEPALSFGVGKSDVSKIFLHNPYVLMKIDPKSVKINKTSHKIGKLTFSGVEI
ncbi:hypothetical protein [Bartonella sp. DGB1]|uniref:hypothetical protein n=1 Tax=Bartonella sp. DGB1 TaxID=3239807 RepID=UPI00352329F4